jgi:hypothetical protein
MLRISLDGEGRINGGAWRIESIFSGLSESEVNHFVNRINKAGFEYNKSQGLKDGTNGYIGVKWAGKCFTINMSSGSSLWKDMTGQVRPDWIDDNGTKQPGTKGRLSEDPVVQWIVAAIKRLESHSRTNRPGFSRLMTIALDGAAHDIHIDTYTESSHSKERKDGRIDYDVTFDGSRRSFVNVTRMLHQIGALDGCVKEMELSEYCGAGNDAWTMVIGMVSGAGLMLLAAASGRANRIRHSNCNSPGPSPHLT